MRILKRLSSAMLMSASLLSGSPASAAEPFSGYLFSYFTGNGPQQEQISFALSMDGIHFQALNGGTPVIGSQLTEMNGLRDPHIFRGQDGQFYMTATDMQSARGWDSNRGIVMMKSPDLVNWTSSAINIPARFPNLFPNATALWAPQAMFDPLFDKNAVYLTINDGDGIFKFHYAHVNDEFTRFEDVPKQLFYTQDNTTVIDSDITESGGKYYLIVKSESPSGRGIRAAVSDHPTWGYTLQTNDPVEQTNQAAEGPQVFKLNDGSGYILIYDEFLAGGFQGVRTTDFKTFTLIPNSDLAALTPRHGGVVSLTADELQTVLANGQNISITRAVQVPSRNRLLQSSPVRATFTSTDLGTLKADNSWASEIWGLSADGSVSVGDSYADPNGRSIRAAVWSGGGLSQKRELGTLKADGSGASKAYAVSKTGAVIAGIAENDDRRLHAVVWSDQNWSRTTDLGTLTTNPRGTSGAYALSADGSIVAGESSVDAGGTHASLWSGQNWSVKQDLGTLRSDNSGISWAYALSSDGSVVGGYSSSDYGVDVDPHATIWSGVNYARKTDLGTLRADNQGISSVRALSGDGGIAAGNASTDSGYTHGAIWSGPSWSRKTDLGTLRADNSGSSWVRALSTDGRVAGGTASSSMGPAHGAVWFGPDWAYRTDLGTLMRGGDGVSEVQALSADGTIAAGYSDMDSGEPHAVLWKISYPALGNPALGNPAGGVDPAGGGTQPLVKIVDATHSVSTIYQLGAETFEALEAQRRSSSRLQITCQADEQRYCWSVNGGFSTDDDGSTIPTGLIGGVGLTDSLTFGTSLNYSLVRPSSASYDDNSQNLGGGVFLDWHQPSGNARWFVRAALSYSQYDVDIHRPTLQNTEEGVGASTISSLGGSVKLGQSVALGYDWSAGWYFGLRSSHLSRDGYKEEGVDFAVTYEDVTYKATLALAGADITIPVAEKLKWNVGLEVERMLANPSVDFVGQAAYIGKVGFSADLEKTWGSLNTGLKYDLDDRMAIGVSASLEGTALGNTAFGGQLSLSGKF